MQNALNSKASSSDIPTKVSDLTNDSGFITNTVNNLTNYYTKTNTYTKSEVDSLISSVSSLDIQIVQTLPTRDISTSTIYLVPKTASTNDNYDEYIYVNNSWEHIGSTEVDLSNYYTKTQTDNLLDDKADVSSLSTVATTGSYNDLTNKPTIPTKTSDLTNDSGFVDNTYHDSTKQNSLVSGTNIKTINNESLLGSGNINITSGGGTMVDMRVNGSSVVDSNNVGNIETEGTYNATTNKIATMSDVPDSTSDLTNDSGFITNFVNNLTNYYTKAETDNLLDAETEYVDVSFLWTAASSGTAITTEQRTLIDTTNKYIFYIKVVDGFDRYYYYSTGRYQDTGDSYTTMDFIYNGEKWCRFYINRSNIVTKTSYDIQRKLVSGSTIKTINNTSLLGSGNISVATTSDIPTKVSDLTNDSGFIDGLEILSYGNSTWNDFITAYQKNKVVYCRASSNSNPASGSQTRLAFMAYVNNATSPTEVEFQYYRSVSSHSDSQQGDQVFVYKLTSSGSWTVTTRNAFSKVVAGAGLSSSYSNGAITLSANSQNETDPVFSASAASGITSSDITNWNSKQAALVSGTNIKTVNNQSLLGSGNISITGGANNIENGTGTYSLKQAGNNTASGEYSFASGTQTTASKYGSHAEGAYTTASGHFSHAEGFYTTASGQGAHAEGAYTTAKGQVQHVSGQYNVIDNANKYIEIVGNGTPSANSNARTLDWNGNEVLAGKLTVGTGPTSNMDVATKQYVDSLVLNMVYPVGSIYMSVNSTSPATLFGGTWVAIAEGRTLVGVGTGTDINGDSMTWTAEAEGGEYLHTLTIDEMPSHSHVGAIAVANRISGGQYYYFNAAGTTSSNPTDTTAFSNSIVTRNTGGGQAHNNIQPFFAVYMWKRAA